VSALARRYQLRRGLLVSILVSKSNPLFPDTLPLRPFETVFTRADEDEDEQDAEHFD
jgi:hypothetical protein